MNVLSLFDGMSCGQIALKELGLKVDNYFASEIDKFAIQQTQHNFPNTIQLGSVTDIRAKDLPKIDLLIGGSPCQGFSFAGKQLNFNDPRSALFFEFVRLKKELKPTYFLLENVNMKKEYLRVISEYLGVFPVRINSNLVSAQNRDRWYWSNIKTKDVGLFAELWTDIPQPEDKGILLKDILQPENEIDEKYYIKNPKVGFNGMDINGKGNNLRIGGQRSQSKKHNYDIIKLDKTLKTKPDQNKASCFTAGGNSGGNHSDMDITCVAMRGRNPENPSDRKKGDPTEQRLEPKTDGKTNCLTSVAKDNLVLTKSNKRLMKNIRSENEKAQCLLSTSYKGSWANGMTNILVPEATEKGFTEIEPGQCVDLENPKSKTRRGRKMENKSNCLMTGKTQFHKYTEDYKLRRLTPIECSRLQTIPKWYKWIVSDTQIYRMLGNGWTIEVIKHIFSFINGIKKTKIEMKKNNLRLNNTNGIYKTECSTCG